MQYAMMTVMFMPEQKLISVGVDGVADPTETLKPLIEKYKGTLTMSTAAGGTVRFSVTPTDLITIRHFFISDILRDGWEPFAVTDGDAYSKTCLRKAFG